MNRSRRWLCYLVAGLALAAASSLYLQTDFLVQITNQIWACF
jgi:hypothetical protein